jgi:hypothetical protein
VKNPSQWADDCCDNQGFTDKLNQSTVVSRLLVGIGVVSSSACIGFILIVTLTITGLALGQTSSLVTLADIDKVLKFLVFEFWGL